MSQSLLPLRFIDSLSISYGATDPVLRDKRLYPYFYQTVLDDTMYYEALVALLKRFQWNWGGIITSDDDSGQRELQELRKLFSGIPRSAHVLKKKTLIFLKSWSFPEELAHYNEDDAPANCSLVFTTHMFNIPKMLKYFRAVQLSDRPFDMILEEIWMLVFHCFSKNEVKNVLISEVYKLTLHNCSGEERFVNHFYFPTDTTPYQVLMAVRIMAYVFHDLNSILNKKEDRNDAITYDYRYKMPKGRCNNPCQAGSRKVITEGYHICCYDCSPCPEGEFTNTTDSDNCERCPDHEWPNKAKNQCVPRDYEFLSYETDVVALVFSTISILLSLITVFIIGIFILFRNIPIVRANNRNLSFILLNSLMFSLLCVFFFIGRPVDITCMLRQIFYGVFFTVAVSSVLAKTIIVCIAFKATRPDSSWRKCVGVKLPYTVVLVCSSIQILNAVIWLSLSPPYQEYNLDYPGKIIIQCNEGSVLAFYLMLGYMGFLAAVSFVLAFLVRTLPDIYNEAKYITFSMLVFCSVWICAIPAYLSSTGKHMVTVEIFAILASGGGILGCMFLPKCYIILIKSEMNSKGQSKQTFNPHKN
ncbi:vomeronasal type-2 receptor 26-like [Dendropsophus ebraccatus]|uniref:vomeronasal type-2 receptor 26-like n=1 Tax=Dendropsophus ebraccatus TaxID=150705 RepID=UPI00383126BC